jgi:hypothetical protein
VLYAKDADRIVHSSSAGLPLRVADRDSDYVVLESPGFQLVVLRMPDEVASTMTLNVPPTRRANAAIKLVFFVPSLAGVRTAADASGGVLNPPDREWSFHGVKVCDGLDPEGNVIQFREDSG